jgi:hypothetical protein
MEPVRFEDLTPEIRERYSRVIELEERWAINEIEKRLDEVGLRDIFGEGEPPGGSMGDRPGGRYRKHDPMGMRSILEPQFPTPNSSNDPKWNRSRPFKNTIPGNRVSPCAQNLEVWVMSHFGTQLSSQRDRTGFADTYSEMTTRISQAYEHITRGCSEVTDFVVFRGTLWDSDYWDTRWEKHFSKAIKDAKHRAKGAGGESSPALANLVVIQKLHGPKNQPSVLMDARFV